MHNRIRLKKKIIFKKNIRMKKSTFFILIFIFFITALIYLFNFINSKISPVLMDYAELELKKFSNLVINKAITKEMGEEIDISELFVIGKNKDEQINTIDFNPLVVNKILTNITDSVQKNIKYIEQGDLEKIDIDQTALSNYDLNKLGKGIIFEIPSGIIFNNALLSNIGPKIPVKLNLVGDIVSNINTKVTNYGINNAMIEVSVNMELNEQVLLPFLSKKINLTTNIPIAIKLIQGTVPNYYFNGIDKNSPNIAIAVE